MVRKLHEANSAMNILEKTIKDHNVEEENTLKDLNFYKNKNMELTQEIQWTNEKIMNEKDQYIQLKQE